MRVETAALLAIASAAAAQSGAYGQCGGIGWTGATTCISGYTCVYQNDWYSQCLPSSAATSPTTTLRTTTTTTNAVTGSPTIHLCGDSTMARASSGSATQGWGQYLHYSFDGSGYSILNHAIGGRSTRSYTREGRFAAVAAQVKKGDWVVIEFGHNDGGSLSADNGRSVCFGEGSETCTTVYNGVTEIVQTYPTYIKNATTWMLNAGAAGVIISAPTPNNVCETGTCSWSPYRFDWYAYVAARDMGGAAKGVYYIPHGAYAAQAQINLGAATTNANYPVDHTHTGPWMADVMSKSFVLGLKCGAPIGTVSPLGTGAINSTASLTSTFLGGCISLETALRGYI